MSLLDDVAAEARTVGPKCTLPGILATMDPADAADLMTAIRDRKYQIPAIIRAAAGRNVEITKNIVERHRNDGCKTCRIS